MVLNLQCHHSQSLFCQHVKWSCVSLIMLIASVSQFQEAGWNYPWEGYSLLPHILWLCTSCKIPRGRESSLWTVITPFSVAGIIWVPSVTAAQEDQLVHCARRWFQILVRRKPRAISDWQQWDFVFLSLKKELWPTTWSAPVKTC